MKVHQIDDGMKVQPNCVYVIPPNKDLSIVQGILRMSKVNVLYQTKHEKSIAQIQNVLDMGYTLQYDDEVSTRKKYFSDKDLRFICSNLVSCRL